MSERGGGGSLQGPTMLRWAARRNASPVCHLPPLLRLAQHLQQQALPKTKPPSPASAFPIPCPSDWPQHGTWAPDPARLWPHTFLASDPLPRSLCLTAMYVGHILSIRVVPCLDRQFRPHLSTALLIPTIVHSRTKPRNLEADDHLGTLASAT